MYDLLREALERADIGIIIIDDSHSIRFINRYIEKLSGILYEQALGQNLAKLFPVFAGNRYQDILKKTLEQNQKRFCSSLIHHAFIYPQKNPGVDVRQNMQVEPVTINGNVFVMLQVRDITDRVNNEMKLTSLINELKKGYLEIKESEEYIRKIAQTDLLTGLLSRHAMMQIIGNVLKSNDIAGGYALMFLDLDGFKNINDTYGHLAGDQLLKKFAQRLLLNTRKDDFIARLGGDEFLVLLSSIHSKQNAVHVAKKLLEDFKKPVEVENSPILITASIGIAMFDFTVRSVSEIIRRADFAMYQAKQMGKNTFVLFEDLK
ncbi:MAG TPA: GGDEF domain-containing protein [Clostridia bacterium]|nr:GGDEF domain-containing protein [Clostridia bacterium]